MKVVDDNSLLVDISDALSERDRVRFTVHTRTTLPHFAKPVLSVVRQHEEFIWLHDCLEDNDLYAGYIIPPPPPKPDFDASREKLQRLGDGEANMTKEEFAKMKQELEAEYLAIFKKTVAMHEIFLQRLAAHEKFKDDNNFKIFLEYENELAVRSKSKKEKIAGSIQNIGKSLTDFVITTSQIAATTSASTSLLVGNHSSLTRQQASPSSSAASRNNKQILGTTTAEQQQEQQQHEQHKQNGSNSSQSDIIQHSSSSNNNTNTLDPSSNSSLSNSRTTTTVTNIITGDGNNNNQMSSNTNTITNQDQNNDDVYKDEQYFEKERLCLALYHDSIKDTAIQADKVTQLQKAVADDYLYIAQQLIKLASIEVVPITSQTKDSSTYVSCPLPSLTMPTQPSITFKSSSSYSSTPLSSSNSPLPGTSADNNNTANSSHSKQQSSNDDDDNHLDDTDISRDLGNNSGRKDINPAIHSDKSMTSSTINDGKIKDSSGSKKGCASDHTSEGLKRLLLYVSDYLEQAKKLETRVASDEDLKLTDTFLYYKRDTVAAQNLLARRLRYLAEYETATKSLEKVRQKGRNHMQYADVIQKQARENFMSVSKFAKQELIDYKQRRVVAFRKAFNGLVELELKQLRSHAQLIKNCLDACNGLTDGFEPSKIVKNSRVASTSGLNIKAEREEPGAKLTSVDSSSSKAVKNDNNN